MRPLALWLPLIFAAQMLHAQGYLDEPKRFQTALAQITTAAGGDVEVVGFRADDNAILVISRDPKGGPGLVEWDIQAVKVLGLHASRLTGPVPAKAQDDLSVGKVSFALAYFQTDAFARTLAAARSAVRMDGGTSVSQVEIVGPASFGAVTGIGSVRWFITVTSPGESAFVIMEGDGTYVGADISGTNRWRARYFLTQDWPFHHAQQAFQWFVKSAPVVRSIEISPKEITLTAALPDAPDTLRAWVWDGGKYSPALVSVTPPVVQRGVAFSLDEVDLTQIARVRDTAMRAVGPDALIAAAVRVTAAPGSGGAPLVSWTVDIKTTVKDAIFPKAEITTVVLGMDGAVSAIVTPDDKRAVADKTLPDKLVATIAAFRDALGPTTRLYDISFRPDSATLKRPHPTRPGMTVSADLSDAGLRDGSEFPVMMETDADLFDLRTLSSIDAALIETIRTQAVAALGIEGGAIHRISLWSGQPFWRDPRGLPLFDVRVGVPPDFQIGGYAVFTMDGKLVEAIK